MDPEKHRFFSRKLDHHGLICIASLNWEYIIGALRSDWSIFVLVCQLLLARDDQDTYRIFHEAGLKMFRAPMTVREGVGKQVTEKGGPGGR